MADGGVFRESPVLGGVTASISVASTAMLPRVIASPGDSVILPQTSPCSRCRPRVVTSHRSLTRPWPLSARTRCPRLGCLEVQSPPRSGGSMRLGVAPIIERVPVTLQAARLRPLSPPGNHPRLGGVQTVSSWRPDHGLDSRETARSMIFDSVYDTYPVDVTYVRVIDGRLAALAHLPSLTGANDSEIWTLEGVLIQPPCTSHLPPLPIDCAELHEIASLLRRDQTRYQPRSHRPSPRMRRWRAPVPVYSDRQ